MNKFWPRRDSPKGFSIEKLASKYREKISSNQFNKSNFSNNNDNPLQAKINRIDSSENKIISISQDNIHWANRDFIEYKEAA